MLTVHRNSSIEWKPTAVLALATSVDGSQVAAAREDGSVEVWLVSPGSVGWHCHLTIHGNSDSRVSSLVWCRSSTTGSPLGRLFSSSIDGTISEWDLYGLKQKVVLESIGVSIWQMAAAPYSSWPLTKHGPLKKENSQENAQLGIGQVSSSSEKDSCGDSDSESKSDSDSGTSESEDDMDTVELHKQQKTEKPHVALACDDGFVRLYEISDSENLIYLKSMTRVSGRVLSVTWSPDGNFIFSGSSDGFIRCWDSRVSHEKYRITVGLGSSGSGPDLCIWSLLVLRSGTLVSGDSTGTVQFWDSQHGTLLQAHSYHKGDVNALAAVPGHHRICSAGADGQVILYKLSSDSVDNDDDYTSMEVRKRWVHVGCVRAHSHDVRALTVAVPICEEDLLPEEKLKPLRGKDKPVDFSYRKWAHFGVPMLISAGDDTKLFAYSAKKFTQFAPHDICPAPQKVPTQLVLNTVFDQMPLLLIQGSFCLDIYRVRMKNNAATTDLLARVNTKRSRKLICSTISSSGLYFAYSDHVKPSLFQLKKSKNNLWLVNKRKIPSDLPFAHSMTFSSDSSRLILAGHDKRLYVVGVGSGELVHTFTPRVRELNEELPPTEPPVTKMYLSPDGQWLAAVNCFGDIYVFNLEIQRQHWFISRLDGASVTAGGFTPKNSNVLIISTSSNQVYAFDVEAKQLGEWSMRHTFVLPRRYQDFPGEVIGLSFPPSPNSSSIIIYSSRAMCLIDFGLPIDKDDDKVLSNGHDPTLKKSQNSPVKGILKRKLKAHDHSRKNFEFCAFRDPVLFVGHLSRNSVLVLDKPWLEVVKTLDTAPVHRHIYGT